MSSAPSMVHRNDSGELVVRSVVSGHRLYASTPPAHQSDSTTSLVDDENDDDECYFPSQEDDDSLPECRVRRNYACTLCDYYTQNPRSFLHHKRDEHDEKMKIYECQRCLYASKHSQKLHRHVQMVHMVAAKAKHIARNNVGGANFSPKDNAPSLQYNPGTFANTTATQEQSNDSFNRQLSVPAFACSHCDYIARNQTTLAKHEKALHMKKKFYRCMKCNYMTHIKARFTKHVKYHTMPMIKCDFCDFKTPYKWNLDRHCKNHGGEGAFKCSACSFTADIKQSLTVHEMNHHDPPVNFGGERVAFPGKRRCKVGGSDLVQGATQPSSAQAPTENINVANSPEYLSTEYLQNQFVQTSFYYDNEYTQTISVAASNLNHQRILLPKPAHEDRMPTNCNRTDEIRTKSGNVYKKKYKCRMCAYTAAWESEMNRHESRVHGLVVPAQAKRQHKPLPAVPNLIPIQANIGVAMQPDVELTPIVKKEQMEAAESMTEEDLNDICVKSCPTSSLKDFASVIEGGESAFTNTRTGQETFKKQPLLEVFKKKNATFFDRIKEKLNVKVDDNLTCVVCGHKSECLSEHYSHKKLHDQNFSPAGPNYISPSGLLTSLRCQFCRHRCKSSSDLIMHERTCTTLTTITPGWNGANAFVKDEAQEMDYEMELSAGDANQNYKMEIDTGEENAFNNVSYDNDASNYNNASYDHNASYDNDEYNNASYDINTYSGDNNEGFYGTEEGNEVGENENSGLYCGDGGFYHHENNASRDDNGGGLGGINDGSDNGSVRAREGNENAQPSGEDENKLFVWSHFMDEAGQQNDARVKKGNLATASSKVDGKARNMVEGSSDMNIPQKKVFQCSHCSFWASTASRFHVHMCTHLNERPFECSGCSYRSNWSWDVTKHIKLKEHRDARHANATVNTVNDSGIRNYAKYDKYLVMPDSRHLLSSEEEQYNASNGGAAAALSTRAGVDATTSDAQTQSNVQAKSSAKVEDSITSTETRKSMWKCKQCLFRNYDKNLVLTHVRGHYVRESYEEASPSFPGNSPKENANGNFSWSTTNAQFPDSKQESLEYIWRCEVCVFRASSEAELQGHMINHEQNPNATYKCCYCPFYVYTRTELATHVIIHGEVGLPEETDSEGMSVYYNNYNTLPRRWFHTNNSDRVSKKIRSPANKRFRCSKCPYVTNNKSQSDYHEKFHLPRDDAPYKCDVCSYSVTKRHLLHQHTRIHNPALETQESTLHQPLHYFDERNMKEITLVWVRRGGAFQKLFKCRQCPFVNVKSDAILEHESSHIENLKDDKMPEHLCAECSFFAKSAASLTTHYKVHRGYSGRIYAPVDAVMTEEEQLAQLDVFIVSEDRRNDVGKFFHDGDLPSASVNSESTNEKSFDSWNDVKGSAYENGEGALGKYLYFCPKCPARYFFIDKLQAHMRFHTANGKFNCKYCSYASRSNHTLATHNKVHLEDYNQKTEILCATHNASSNFPRPVTISCMYGSGPFDVCWVVNSADESVLPRQERPKAPAEKPFSCVKCGGRFVKYRALQHHLTLHNANNPHKCRMCDYSVKNSGNLMKHEVDVHQLSPPNYADVRMQFAPTQFKKERQSAESAPSFVVRESAETNIASSAEVKNAEKKTDCDMAKNLYLKPDSEFGMLLHGDPRFTYPTTVKNGKIRERRYKCAKCPSAFEKRDSYKTHILLHGSGQRFKCNKCDYAVKHFANFTYHLKRHYFDEKKGGEETNSHYEAPRLEDYVDPYWLGDGNDINEEQNINNEFENVIKEYDNIDNEEGNVYNREKNFYNEKINVYNEEKNVFNEARNIYNEEKNVYEAKNINNEEKKVYNEDENVYEGQNVIHYVGKANEEKNIINKVQIVGNKEQNVIYYVGKVENEEENDIYEDENFSNEEKNNIYEDENVNNQEENHTYEGENINNEEENNIYEEENIINEGQEANNDNNEALKVVDEEQNLINANGNMDYKEQKNSNEEENITNEGLEVINDFGEEEKADKNETPYCIASKSLKPSWEEQLSLIAHVKNMAPLPLMVKDNSKILFQCDLCPYRNQRRDKYEMHVKRHGTEGANKCKYCDYSVPQTIYLRNHEKLHFRKNCDSVCGYIQYDESSTWVVLDEHDEPILTFGFSDSANNDPKEGGDSCLKLKIKKRLINNENGEMKKVDESENIGDKEKLPEGENFTTIKNKSGEGSEPTKNKKFEENNLEADSNVTRGLANDGDRNLRSKKRKEKASYEKNNNDVCESIECDESPKKKIKAKIPKNEVKSRDFQRKSETGESTRFSLRDLFDSTGANKTGNYAEMIYNLRNKIKLERNKLKFKEIFARKNCYSSSSENDNSASENDNSASENDNSASENDNSASENDNSASENDNAPSENDIPSLEYDHVTENNENSSIASESYFSSDANTEETSSSGGVNSELDLRIEDNQGNQKSIEDSMDVDECVSQDPALLSPLFRFESSNSLDSASSVNFSISISGSASSTSSSSSAGASIITVSSDEY